jgi:hypothetical protein
MCHISTHVTRTQIYGDFVCQMHKQTCFVVHALRVAFPHSTVLWDMHTVVYTVYTQSLSRGTTHSWFSLSRKKHNLLLARLEVDWLLVASNCEKGILASTCLSVRLYVWTKFHENCYLKIFSSISRKIKFRVDLTRKTNLCPEDLEIFFYQFSLLFIIKIFLRIIVEKIKTHILWQKFLFRKSWQLRDNVEKYYSPL